MNEIKHTFAYGKDKITLSTGKIARQADGAVLIEVGETAILVTVVYSKEEANDALDFFPLTVNYQEKAYASGRIPGGFVKRESKPSEQEVLISRLIDRPVRPLFPKKFTKEVQIVATLLSLDSEIAPEIPVLLATSAALKLSGLPMLSSLGAARVGYINNQYILNPSRDELDNSELDLVVAGTKKAALMIESEAKELSEQVMLDAVFFGHEKMQAAIGEIEKFADLVADKQGITKCSWEANATDPELIKDLAVYANAKIDKAYKILNKTEREAALREVREDVVAYFLDILKQDESLDLEAAANIIKTELKDLEKQLVRTKILETKTRIDNRSNTDIRDITIETPVFSRLHGSALFTRGETQALVTCTLGTERDGQIVNGSDGEYKEVFLLHYNFPPYSVGETGFMSAPKRREIGHGNLAKRAVQPLIPLLTEFPYVVRLVSEITESNGSSSMATVCGASLALMDAGVPIKSPVAGIAMGLIKESSSYIVLSDIMGAEDHLGDMDFKVAGTTTGITALQMDIKIEGIDKAIMQQALAQAKTGREHILSKMNAVIDKPREDISPHAPRIIIMQIDSGKIKDVIGKGGSTIKALTEPSGSTIDIEDSGLVKVGSPDLQTANDIKKRIELLTADVEVGRTYEGTVVKIVEFGAFVNVLPSKDGLVHISHISEDRVKNVSDHLSEGQMIKVKVLEIDRQGKIRLSMKEAE